MPVPYLRLVPTGTPTATLTAFDRITAAVGRMLADAQRLRMNAHSLDRSSRALSALANQIQEKLPLFDDARERLSIERDRAREIANDAALLERRILQSSPGNLVPLTTGLPPRLQATAANGSAA